MSVSQTLTLTQPEPSTIPVKPYSALIAEIKKALARGLLAAQRALEYQRLMTYWQIGRRINRAVASSNGELRLNSAFYEQVSQDIEKAFGLNLTADTIGRMVQFHNNYPRFPLKTPLTFTHYLALLRIPDSKLRLGLEQKAIAQNLSALDIKMAIAEFKVKLNSTKPNSSSKLKCERGEPYVYRLKSFKDLYGNEELRIDCGFKLDIPLKGMIIQKRISSIIDKHRGVRVIKQDNQYHVQIHKKAYEKLYTYPASVINVIDADTIDVRIDVGFSIKLNDRLRFKGINAPELSTPEGRVARQFLVDYFSACPIVVLRTYKEEMYGRWLTDVFAIKGCNDPYRIAAEGEYLNQVLLDKGLAERY